MRTSREACSGWGAVELSFLGATLHVSTHAPSTCTDVSPPRAGSGPEVPVPAGAGPAPAGIVGQLPRIRGRTPGLPPAGRPPPAAGGAAVVLRTARRSRRRGSTCGVATCLAVGPAARSHRPDEPRCVLRGCVRAPPRAPRAGRGVHPPAAGADAVRGPRSASGFTGARASRCRADAKTGSQPAARSAASTAASRPIPDGISRRAMPAQGPAHGPGSPTRR